MIRCYSRFILAVAAKLREGRSGDLRRIGRTVRDRCTCSCDMPVHEITKTRTRDEARMKRVDYMHAHSPKRSRADLAKSPISAASTSFGCSANLWRDAVSATDPVAHPAGVNGLLATSEHADHADRARLRLYKSDALRCGVSRLVG